MNEDRFNNEIELADSKRIGLANKIYETYSLLDKQVNAYDNFTKMGTASVMHYTYLVSIRDTLYKIWEDMLDLDNKRTYTIEWLKEIIDTLEYSDLKEPEKKGKDDD